MTSPPARLFQGTARKRQAAPHLINAARKRLRLRCLKESGRTRQFRFVVFPWYDSPMSRLIRWLQRVLIFLVAATTSWLIVTQFFERLEHRIPAFAALLATYVIAAYGILPIVLRASASVLRYDRIPRVTRAADGLAADPVNMVLIGTQEQLRSAFAAANWYVADPLTPRTALRMIVCFALNRPYPAAPFSALYLYGRRQDIGFQEPVGDSPRRRHHVRFWAADEEPDNELDDVAYWTRRRRIDPTRSHIWIGAGTTDTGFGFQAMTYQISHRVDRNADRERDHIISALRDAGQIQDEGFIASGALIGSRFVTDGRIFRACLVS